MHTYIIIKNCSILNLCHECFLSNNSLKSTWSVEWHPPPINYAAINLKIKYMPTLQSWRINTNNPVPLHANSTQDPEILAMTWYASDLEFFQLDHRILFFPSFWFKLILASPVFRMLDLWDGFRCFLADADKLFSVWNICFVFSSPRMAFSLSLRALFIKGHGFSAAPFKTYTWIQLKNIKYTWKKIFRQLWPKKKSVSKYFRAKLCVKQKELWGFFPREKKPYIVNLQL